MLLSPIYNTINKQNEKSDLVWGHTVSDGLNLARKPVLSDI